MPRIQASSLMGLPSAPKSRTDSSVRLNSFPRSFASGRRRSTELPFSGLVILNRICFFAIFTSSAWKSASLFKFERVGDIVFVKVNVKIVAVELVNHPISELLGAYLLL